MNAKGQLVRVVSVFIATLLLVTQFVMAQPIHVFAENIQNGAMVTVLDRDGEPIISTKAVSFEDGDTAKELLESVAEVVTFESTEYGPFLTGIDGHFPDDTDYWGFFINGESSMVGVADYTVQHGDHILFKIVDGSMWPPASVNVTVTAVDGEGQVVIPETDLSVVEGGTAYDALLQAAKTNGVNVEISIDSEWLAMLTGLNDIPLGDTEFWTTYMNGQSMQVGLSAYQLHECDRLYVTVASFAGDGFPSTIEEEVEKSKNCPSTGEENETPTDGNENQTGSDENISEVIDQVDQYLQSTSSLDWYAYIAYASLGKEIPDSVIEQTVEEIESVNGVFRNVTDLEKAILILTAAGKDASQVAGYDLIDLLVNHERMTNQGNNGVILALLALDGGNYPISENAEWTREKLIREIISSQLDSGGWSLFGDTPSTDITGFALAALSPYKDREDVQNSIEKAVQWLSNIQAETGGFDEDFNGGEASESIAQVIVGLTANGIDPTGDQFTKSEGNLVQRLLSFFKDDGGFAHLPSDEDANAISSNQALLALTAYKNYLEGNGSVFQFRDLSNSLDPISDTTVSDEETETQSTAEKSDGKTLPNTATSNEQILLFGILLVLFAMFSYQLYRKSYSK
ncbi:DUF4430 domain-containing protein [Fervidibacillus albus]|uniref:DUF4430 domain-containing protein n=1 Tax=Fervidibacillus albus TaxID=2980026 RepID=A0A9E8RW31_9BACI|nr:DUF4430 domain-containing protein [Fervidibacillus albus]WAA09588.1 DUF4430 domain-containing protein [Fervidibacillus albus]